MKHQFTSNGDDSQYGIGGDPATTKSSRTGDNQFNGYKSTGTAKSGGDDTNNGPNSSFKLSERRKKRGVRNFRHKNYDEDENMD